LVAFQRRKMSRDRRISLKGSLNHGEPFHNGRSIKHNGFREEFEWRVIFQVARDALFAIDKKGKPNSLKFRDVQFGRTPFIEIPLDLAKPERSPLRRIVVGPGTHKEDVKRWVELFLLSRGIQVMRPDTGEGVEIATSLIPYRSG